MDGVEAFGKQATLGFQGYVRQQLNIVPEKHYRFVKVKDSPRVMCMYLLINPALLKSLMQMEQPLSMAMGLQKEHTARIRRYDGRVVRIELPKPRQLCFPIEDKDLPSRVGKAIVGCDLDGKNIFVDLAKPLQAHVLIAGMTGCGKTYLQRGIVSALCKAYTQSELGICIIDVTKRGILWSEFENKAHMLGSVVMDDMQALRTAAWFVRELDIRAENKMVPPAVPRLVLVIDEFADLVDGPVGQQIAQHLAKITQVGREYGIHCIVSTQHPIMSAMGSSLMKRQFGVRFIGKMDDGRAAQVAAGVDDCGAQYLSGAGDFILAREDILTRFQAAIPTSASINLLPVAMERREIDLTGIEDPALILSQVKVGRPEEALDMTIVGKYLGKLAEKGMPESMHTAGSWISPRIGASKAERHIKTAQLAYNALTAEGYRVIKE